MSSGSPRKAIEVIICQYIWVRRPDSGRQNYIAANTKIAPTIAIIPMIRLAIASPFPLNLSGFFFILLRLIPPNITPISPRGMPATNKPTKLDTKPAIPNPSVFTMALSLPESVALLDVRIS